jgi:hypothetical protein
MNGIVTSHSIANIDFLIDLSPVVCCWKKRARNPADVGGVPGSGFKYLWPLI